MSDEFRKGDTDPVGDCDKFEAGIHVGKWAQRIVVYGDTAKEAEILRDHLLNKLTTTVDESCGQGGGEVVGWIVTDMNGDSYFAYDQQTPSDRPLVYRAHVTRLQADIGQTGEYPCSACVVPMTHDAPAVKGDE